jgi:uncharacterized protein
MSDVEAKQLRGFALLSPELRRAYAAKGGQSVDPKNRSFSRNSDLAQRAGKKGGHAVPPEKRAFSVDRSLASRAGRRAPNNAAAE